MDSWLKEEIGEWYRLFDASSLTCNLAMAVCAFVSGNSAIIQVVMVTMMLVFCVATDRCHVHVLADYLEEVANENDLKTLKKSTFGANALELISIAVGIWILLEERTSHVAVVAFMILGCVANLAYTALLLVKEKKTQSYT